MANFPVSIETFHLKLRENFNLILRVLIISAVLGVSGLVLPRTPESRLNIFLFLLVGLPFVLVFLHRPQLGIAALIIGSAFFSLEINTGTGTYISITVVLVMLLTGLWLLDTFVRKRRLYFSAPLLPLIGFSIAVLLSFGAGQLSWFPYGQSAPLTSQIGATAIFLITIAAFLLGAFQIRTVDWLKNIVWIYLACGAFFIFSWFGFSKIPVVAFFIPGGAQGGLFGAWVVALAGSQLLFNRSLKPSWRLALGLLVITALFTRVVMRRDYSSGWIPMVVSLLILITLKKPKLGLFGFLMGGLLLVIYFPKVQYILLEGNEYSLDTRLEAWRIMYKIIQLNPILGLGPANYRNITVYFPIMGWYVPFNSHNNYIDIIAQTGILGMFFFLWLAFELGRLGLRLRNRVPEGFLQGFVAGALGGLGGMMAAAMLGDWVIPYLYNIGYRGLRASAPAWLFLGTLVLLDHLYGKQSGSSTSARSS